MRSLKLSLFAVLFSLTATSTIAESTGQPVRVSAVESLPIKRAVSTYGVLAPKIEDLSFRINGRISSFNAAEGETVKAGQVLA